jgi:HAD superfamily hydrolase (TIGR01509 family)
VTAVPTLIFDCDGVLADTERHGHLPAFNQAFEEFGIPVHWSETDYAEKVLIGGGKERMLRALHEEVVQTSEAVPTGAEARRELVARLHWRKTAIYTALVERGALPARPGIARIAEDALAAGWTLAVASTSAEASVRAVLTHAVGSSLAERVAVFAGDRVASKKPAPDIYLLALAELGVSADDVIVIEDSRNGLRAAHSAGLRTVVTVSSYTVDENFAEAQLVVTSLGDQPPGEPARVLADQGSLRLGAFLTLDDLATILHREIGPVHGTTTPKSVTPPPSTLQETP